MRSSTSSPGQPHAVLIVDPVNARRRRVAEALRSVGDFAVSDVRSLPEALATEDPDVILLAPEFTRQDWNRIMFELRGHFSAAIVALIPAVEEENALEVLATGADDVVVTSSDNSGFLRTQLLLTIARRERQQQVAALIYIDSLTGLCNHRGFLVEGEQQLALAQRSDLPLVVLFLDIDGLKEINDALGHLTGDRALIDMADLLRQTFRKSDVLARIGGDEFAVILRSPDHPSLTSTKSRVEQAITQFNRKNSRPYELSASLGTATAAPAEQRSLAEILERADNEMYEEKRRRRAPRKTA